MQCVCQKCRMVCTCVVFRSHISDVVIWYVFCFCSICVFTSQPSDVV